MRLGCPTVDCCWPDAPPAPYLHPTSEARMFPAARRPTQTTLRPSPASIHYPLSTVHYPLSPVHCLLLLLLTGCPGPQPNSNPQPTEQPWAGVQLRLGVADDREMAAAAARIQGQWQALTGGRLQVELLTVAQLE